MRAEATPQVRPGTTPTGQVQAPPLARAPRPVAAPPPTPDVRAMSPEEQKAHDDARRFARLVVSEIKLYNEAKVSEGRQTRDIYERLKEDIERGRQMYNDRVGTSVRETTDYFQDELVRILGGGDRPAPRSRPFARPSPSSRPRSGPPPSWRFPSATRAPSPGASRAWPRA
jgi:hypothetical protein